MKRIFSQLGYWIWIALGIHLLTAWRSRGYYAFDEHFQILEFANAYLGRSDPLTLPWEYPTQMRSWFQPWTFATLVRGLQAIGIDNPFTWGTVYRECGAILGWVSLVGICLEIRKRKWSVQIQRFTTFFACTVWFIPYLHARTSSENWSSSLLTLGILLLLKDQKASKRSLKMAMGAGILLALAFAARFQAAFCILGLVVYEIFRAKIPFRSFLGVTFGFLLGTGAMFLLDSHCYGAWTFTPWNFFYQNIYLKKSEAFSPQPWWWYFKEIILYYPPLSVFLLACGIYGLWRERKSIWSFATLPYLGVHFYLVNKQLRFYFPLILWVPFWVGASLEKAPRKIFCIFQWTYQIMNPIFLLGIMVLPAHSKLPFYEYLYTLKGKNIVVKARTEDPFTAARLVHYYYIPEGVSFNRYSDEAELFRSARRSKEEHWIFEDEPFSMPESNAWLAERCKRVYTNRPDWLKKFNFGAKGGWISRTRFWNLYQCVPKNS